MKALRAKKIIEKKFLELQIAKYILEQDNYSQEVVLTI